MNLREIRAAHPSVFYGQNWFDGHAFAEERYSLGLTMPDRVAPTRGEPVRPWALPHASQLADLYVRYPTDDLWRGFLWTSDRDDFGQQVYVGGVGLFVENFQIHRHLKLNESWSVPVWDGERW